jgi:hypothetical protein
MRPWTSLNPPNRPLLDSFLQANPVLQQIPRFVRAHGKLAE